MSEEEKGSERRTHPRVPMMVKVTNLDTGEELQHFSREVSVGGMFLELEAPFTVGTRLSVQFQIPGTNHHVHAKGEVVHQVTAETTTRGNPRPGVGVKFVDMDGNSEQNIMDYVEKLQKIRQKLSK